MTPREPMFNVPSAVVGAIAVLSAIHLALWFLDEADQLGIRAHLAFQPARYSAGPALLAGDWPGARVWSFLTHQLVHVDATHLAMNSAWLLAFGGAVAARVGNLRFILLGFASGIAGALVFLAFRWFDPVPMIGASGGVSGLMGGAFRFFYNHADARQFDPDADPRDVPRMSLRETFTDRRVLTMILIWGAVNFLTAAAGFLLTNGGGIAWEAHLGGFLFGMLGFALFDPPLRRSPPVPVATDRPTLH